MNKNILLTIVLLLSLTSCVQDELTGIDRYAPEKGIRIYAGAVGHTVVETRAVADENAITDMHVLVFRSEDDVLTEHKKASLFSNGEIYVNLTHTTVPSQILLLANVDGIVANATDPFGEGATLATITDKLLLHAGMMENNPQTGYSFNAMPMLSSLVEASAGIDYNTQLGTYDTPLSLTHRLSKISVQSNVSNLTIEAFSLRHAPASGGKLLLYTPGSDPTPAITDRINYFGADDDTNPKFVANNQSLNFFSSSNTDIASPMELIVKARYDTDASSTYYHIKLDKKSADGTSRALFDFEPGKHYRIVFTKVTSPGYPTLKEAIDNEYSNVEYEITDDTAMGEVFTNGQYMIGATNSDCRIYGDFDPAFEYPIADIVTNAPATAQIEIKAIGTDFTVVTKPSDIRRDGNTSTRLKVKFKNQFTSGSLSLRVGNLTKVFTFSIELDPPYVQVDDLLEARIASGFESKTIALSKSPYNEKIKPTDLTDRLTTSTAYVHFNKITLGDETRIGEAYLTHKTNIHYTKLMVVQRPYVEIGGTKFATGNIVICWHPDGTRRYKIGAALEYGIVFHFSSYYGLDYGQKLDDPWTSQHQVYKPVSLTPNSPINSQSGYTDFSGQVRIGLVDAENLGRPRVDPCNALSTQSNLRWKTAHINDMDLLINHKGGPGATSTGYHVSPNGAVIKNAELFIVSNGRVEANGVRYRVDSQAILWAFPNGYSLHFRYSTIEFLPNLTNVTNLAYSVRCVVDGNAPVTPPVTPPEAPSEIIGYFGGDPATTTADQDVMYPKLMAVSLVESEKQYKTTLTNNNPAITNSIFYGRDVNITAAALSGAETLATYPAFEYCAKLNTDLNNNGIIDDSEMIWYLPSQNQLIAMYVFNGGLNNPLNHPLGRLAPYWSATYSGNRAMVMNFGTLKSGTMTYGNNNTNAGVRCVRDVKP